MGLGLGLGLELELGLGLGLGLGLSRRTGPRWSAVATTPPPRPPQRAPTHGDVPQAKVCMRALKAAPHGPHGTAAAHSSEAPG